MGETEEDVMAIKELESSQPRRVVLDHGGYFTPYKNSLTAKTF